MTEEFQLPSLTFEQMEVLRKFALFDVGIEEMRRALAGVFDLHFEPQQSTAEDNAQRQTATTNFRVPEPGIVITREHIQNALERKRFDLIRERDLTIWATVLLLNDAYVLDPADEDLIAEWLNDISLHFSAS